MGTTGLRTVPEVARELRVDHEGEMTDHTRGRSRRDQVLRRNSGQILGVR